MNFAELKLFFINLFTVPDLKPGLEGAHHTAYKNMLLGTATKSICTGKKLYGGELGTPNLGQYWSY